jgi:hypothetical protein
MAGNSRALSGPKAGAWLDTMPSRYTLHYEAPNGAPHTLIADCLEDAKLEAAILYACVDAPRPPRSYRIVKGARTVVYRYPELAA